MEPILFEYSTWILSYLIVFFFSYSFYDKEEYYLYSNNLENESDYFEKNAMPLLPKYLVPKNQHRKWFFVFLSGTSLLFFVLYIIFKRIEPENFSELNIPIYYKAFPQLLAAFVIAGIIPMLPDKLGLFVKHLRTFAHNQARIPEFAKSIYNHVLENGFSISDSNKKDTIDYISNHYEPNILSIADFNSKQSSPELFWAYCCYLRFFINSVSLGKYGEIYAINLQKKELACEGVISSFNNLYKEILELKKLNNIVYGKFVIFQLKSLFYKMSQLIICLVFCSEKDSTNVYKKINEIGIQISFSTFKYKVNYGKIIGSVLVSFFAIFLTAFLITPVISYIGIKTMDNNIDSIFAVNTAMAAVFIVFLPIFVVFLFKHIFTNKWPIRGQFTKRNLDPAIIMFIVSGGLGIAGFFFVDFIGALDFEPGWWRNRLQYTLLPATGGFIVARCIDRKPEIWRPFYAFLRAFSCGVTSMLAFFFMGGIAIIWSEGISSKTDVIDALTNIHAFKFYVIGACGFIAGSLMSLVSQISSSFKDKKEELYANIQLYIAPILRNQNFDPKDKKSIEKTISKCAYKFPKKLIEYLKQENFLDDELNLNENSFREIRTMLD
jgi:hypothetical protein